MRSNFFTIVLSILLSLTLASCNSSRRAARRIQRITENHPELLTADTVKIDTLLIYGAPADTAVFDPEIVLKTDSCVVMGAAHGTFSVKKLPSRQIQLIYTPDTDTIQFRDQIPVNTVVVQQQDESWRWKLRWAIGIFVGFLLFSRIRGDIKEFLRK